jgi:DNA polymerase-3 subunit chi
LGGAVSAVTEVAFYHLQTSPLEAVLPKLLERTLAQGKRAVVLTQSEARAEALATLLWTYNPASWLPHGTRQDGMAEDQPVWITHLDENPNGATFLFLTDGADSLRLGGFERCFDLFDGNDDDAVARSRERWVARKAAGLQVTYWQQTDSGRWERKG